MAKPCTSGGPPAKIALASGMTISRSPSSCPASCNAWIVARATGTADAMSPRAIATVTSAALACGPHTACPGSTDDELVGRPAPIARRAGAARRRRSRHRAGRPRWPAARAPRSVPMPGPVLVARVIAPSRCRRMPSASPAAARTVPRHSSSFRARVGVGASDATVRGEPEPALRLGDVAKLRVAERDATGGVELDGLIAQQARGAPGLLAPGDHQVRHDLRPGKDVDAEEQLELLAGALALGHELGEARGDPPDLLDVAGRAGEHDDRGVVGVGHGDDRRHDARPIVELLVQGEGALQQRLRLRRRPARWAARRGPPRPALPRRPARPSRTRPRCDSARRTSRGTRDIFSVPSSRVAPARLRSSPSCSASSAARR